MSAYELALPIRPKQNLEARYQIIQTGRESSEVVAVTSTKALCHALPPDLQDSWREIALGPYALQSNYLGFRQWLYGHVTGAGQDDLSTYMLDVKERYGKWRDELRDHTTTLGICHDVCHLDESLRRVARDRHKRHSTIRQQLMYGLKEYSRINRMHVKYLR